MSSKFKDLTVYKSLRPQMKTGDALLWKGNTTIGTIIRWFSKDFDHASIIYNEFRNEEERRFILEAVNKGIVLEMISKRLQEYDGEVYWLQIEDKYKPWRTELGSFALGQVGKDYDFESVIKNIFGRVSINMKKLFCSEYLYLAWRWVWCTYNSIQYENKSAGMLFNDRNLKVFNFLKAPRPAGILKMGVYKHPVRIF